MLQYSLQTTLQRNLDTPNRTIPVVVSVTLQHSIHNGSSNYAAPRRKSGLQGVKEFILVDVLIVELGFWNERQGTRTNEGGNNFYLSFDGSMMKRRATFLIRRVDVTPERTDKE